MRLHLLRHALAVPRGNPSVDSDAQRPLSAEGRVQARRIGQAMRSLGLSFDAIVASPFERAKQTATLVADVLGFRGETRELGQLMPDAEPEHTRDAMVDLQLADDVLAVGHKPHLQRFAAHLLTGTAAGLDVRMGKGALCSIDIALGTPEAYGELQRLMQADELVRSRRG